ncbi:glycerate kinase [Vibrio harveyi]|uniref:glycerate kinase n=1 Tax=Vibrio harveyi TaxID=669 RepID=UPI003D765AA8
MKKIVIAPDSFKESLTAMEVATAIETGFKKVLPDCEYVKLPMADGGEGTVTSLIDATGGELIHVEVTDPLGRKVQGFYGLLGDGKTAVIEMAAASGLHLVEPERRNPLITTTYGTGELIKAALDKEVEHIIIGIGGSATNDGGVGMAQALGVSFVDISGRELGFGGGQLEHLEIIDMNNLDPRLNNVMIQVACDVDNPLCGKHGASHVFGPQKGASESIVAQLDDNLAHYADVINRHLHKNVRDRKGAGAAGGLGAALIAFLDAELKSGIDIVMDAVNLSSEVNNADLVITGEGRIDSQTIYGKTPIGVARTAKKFNIPVVGIAGCLSADYGVVHLHGIDAAFAVVNRFVELPTAMKEAKVNIENTARNIAQMYKL